MKQRMESVAHNIQNYLKDRGINRADLGKFLVVIGGVAVFLAVIIFTPIGSKIGPIVAAVAFAILFIILWSIAGFVVFRSLLAASIGLSLVIFIGQSYCASTVVHSANESLKALLGFGLIYVIVQFGINLYKDLFGEKDSREKWRQKGTIAIFKEINKGKHSWLVLAIYIPLVSLFVWQISQVINPIIQSYYVC